MPGGVPGAGAEAEAGRRRARELRCLVLLVLLLRPSIHELFILTRMHIRHSSSFSRRFCGAPQAAFCTTQT